MDKILSYPWTESVVTSPLLLSPTGKMSDSVVHDDKLAADQQPEPIISAPLKVSDQVNTAAAKEMETLARYTRREIANESETPSNNPRQALTSSNIERNVIRHAGTMEANEEQGIPFSRLDITTSLLVNVDRDVTEMKVGAVNNSCQINNDSVLSENKMTEDPHCPARTAIPDASLQCSKNSSPPHGTVSTDEVTLPEAERTGPTLTSAHSEDQTATRPQPFQKVYKVQLGVVTERYTTTVDVDDPDRDGVSRDTEHLEEIDPSADEHALADPEEQERSEAQISDQRTASISLEAPKDDNRTDSVSSDHDNVRIVDNSETDQTHSLRDEQTIKKNPAIEKADEGIILACVELDDNTLIQDDDDDATQDPVSIDQNIPLVDMKETRDVKSVVEKPKENTLTIKSAEQPRKRRCMSALTCLADSKQPRLETRPTRRQKSGKESVPQLVSVATATQQTSNDDIATQDTATTDGNVPCPAHESLIESPQTFDSKHRDEKSIEIVQTSSSLTEGAKASRKRKEVATHESVHQPMRDLTQSSLESRPSRKRKGLTEPVPAVESVAISSFQTPNVSSVKRKTRSTASKRLTTAIALGRSFLDDPAGDQPIRILTTGVDLDKKQEKMVVSIGGTLLRDTAEAHTATHVIASDGTTDVRRTVKLMIALCCWTTHIVTLDWLIQSSAQRRPLPCTDFRIVDPPRCRETEKAPFRMSRTLQNIERNQRHGMHLLLDRWSVYVCPGVAGKKAPPSPDFQLVVEAAGAVWLTSLADPSASCLDMDHVLVITGDPETKAHVKGVVSTALQGGASKRTTTWFFDAMMRQEVDLPPISFSDRKQI